MEIKKCVHCGAFINSDATVCTSCASKISFANTVLKNYFDDVDCYNSISSISSATGVSPTLIQNYMQENHFNDIPMEIDFKDYYTGIPY